MTKQTSKFPAVLVVTVAMVIPRELNMITGNFDPICQLFSYLERKKNIRHIYLFFVLVK